MNQGRRLRDLPPAAAVMAVAWPMVLVGWLRAAWLSVDGIWVGQLGPEALTGLMACAFAWWIVDQLGELAGTGTQTRVAQAEGAGRREALPGLVSDGLWVAAAIGLGMLMLGRALGGVYVDAIGLAAGSEARAAALAVLGTLAWFAPVLAVQTVVLSVFRGLGDTRTALGLAALGLVVNTAVDPWLIHGVAGLPGLGARGASVAAGIAGTTSAAAGLVMLAQRGVWPAATGPSRVATAAILAIGGPVAVSSVGFSLVYVALGRLVTSLDPHHMAALGVGHRVEGYPYLLCVGVMVGTATVVAQHVGAGDPNRAWEAVRAADAWVSRAMLAWTAVALVGAGWMLDVVTEAPDIRASGALYVRTQAVATLFMAWEVVYEGAFAGTGRTWPAMVVSVVGTVARIPLAYALASAWGIHGVWVAIAASTIAKGVAMRWVFWRMEGRTA